MASSRMIALLGLLAVAGYQNRDRIGQFLGGILAGFSGSWWTSGQLWIWASLVLAIVVVGMMTPMGRFYFNRIRAAVGVDPRTNAADPNFVVDQGAVNAAIASGNPMLLTVVGVGALVILAWLMIVKPF